MESLRAVLSPGWDGMGLQGFVALVPVTSAMFPIALLSQGTSFQALWAPKLFADSLGSLECSVWLLPAHPILHFLCPIPCPVACWEVIQSGAELIPDCSLHCPRSLPACLMAFGSEPKSVCDEEVRE